MVSSAGSVAEIDLGVWLFDANPLNTCPAKICDTAHRPISINHRVFYKLEFLF